MVGYNYRKRIDIVAHVGSDWWVIEAKPPGARNAFPPGPPKNPVGPPWETSLERRAKKPPARCVEHDEAGGEK